MSLIKYPNKWKFCGVVAVASIFAVCCASGQDGDMTIFTKIYVPSTVLLSAGMTDELFLFSPIVCSLQAKLRQWCHLACFDKSDGNCRLYNTSLPSNYRTMDNDPTTDPNDLVGCYTELPRGCVSDNRFYYEGETRMENCTNVTCVDMAWVPTHNDSSDGFESVDGVGCIVIVKNNQDFANNKLHCESLGARLVIPDDFEALRQYVLSKSVVGQIRVGIYNDVWMDGRTVDAVAWAPGEPNVGSEPCSSMWGDGDGRKLHDCPCTFLHYSICQLV